MDRLPTVIVDVAFAWTIDSGTRIMRAKRAERIRPGETERRDFI
jgi:hypothetical protein